MPRYEKTVILKFASSIYLLIKSEIGNFPFISAKVSDFIAFRRNTVCVTGVMFCMHTYGMVFEFLLLKRGICVFCDTNEANIEFYLDKFLVCLIVLHIF